MAQVPAVHRARKVGAVVIPEQQIKRNRFLPLEVFVDVVVPPQFVGAQQGEGIAHVFATKQTDGAIHAADGALAVGHQFFVDEYVDGTGILVIKERGEQAHAGDLSVAACSQYGQRSAQQGAADAETHATESLLATDLAGHLQGVDHPVLNQVFPGSACVFLVKVAPGYQEYRVSLFQQVAEPANLRGVGSDDRDVPARPLQALKKRLLMPLTGLLHELLLR